jgi:hypothetical protein
VLRLNDGKSEEGGTGRILSNAQDFASMLSKSCA